MNIFEEMQWRGLIYDGTEGVREHLSQGSVCAYIGFDPTAASLHVGSLLPIMNLARLQRCGHTAIALVGGGTGLIGDPSGKSAEREMLTPQRVAANCAGIRAQLSHFLDFDHPTHPALLENNGAWIGGMNLVAFLRDVGKHFTVNYMLAKESVSRRLEQDSGISYTEFSYLLLQAYDFVMLNERYDCTLQMGGSDQWGNITAGTELLRRMRQKKVHGLVSPLVTTANGVKFGKTEAGAVWLDPELTSPYRFYQFWRNTTDQDVVPYLKFFTWLDREEIAELESATAENPGQRQAQKRLAREVTSIVHGETAYTRALRSSEVLFGAEIADLEVAEILDIFDDVPSSSLAKAELAGEGQKVVDLLTNSGLLPSKGAARRLLRDGGAYLNNRRLAEDYKVRQEDFLGGQVLVLRQGRKKYHLITLVGD